MKQLKLREINKNPNLHKEVFVLKSDCKEMLQQFYVAAIEAGADDKKMMEALGGSDE